jgi:V/A-type H+-transporting ATPase subunit C
MKSDSFIYASSRLRALAHTLLERAHLDRVIEASKVEDAFKILEDMEYLADPKDQHNFQKMLTLNLADTKELLEKIVDQTRFMDLLFVAYDFHNLKALLKGKKAGKRDEESQAQCLELGRVKVENLSRYLETRDPRDLKCASPELAPQLHAAVQCAEKAYEASQQDPQSLDLVLDQELYKVLAQIAKELGNPFLQELVNMQTDVANLKSLLRIKLLKQESHFPVSKLNELFLEAGSYSTHEWLSLISKTISEVQIFFSKGIYGDTVNRSIQGFELQGDFTPMEKTTQDLLLKHLSKSKTISFGPEPVAAYFYIKQNDARVLRTVLVGKLNGISKESIRARIPNFYL